MIFLDINTFYCTRGGGIRTYHLAKLDYFKRHPEHTYYLVFPGKRWKTVELCGNVVTIEAYGFTTGGGPDGYRILMDYLSVFRLIRKVKPHVVEAGDPWLTGFFCLFAPFGKKTLRSSFYHSDPVNTYFLPWAKAPGKWKNLRLRAAGLAGKMFYYLQNKYQATLVSSQVMLDRLSENGVLNGVYTPFGVDEVFFNTNRKNVSESHIPQKLLYAGRLDFEKGMELLKYVIPKVLERKNISISVAGRGKYADYFQNYRGKGLNYLGFIEQKERLAEIFAQHDIFLFPGQYETFGLGVLEALASGMIVVGPDLGGTGEILKAMNSSFMFSAGSPQSFLDKILSALDSDFLQESLKSRNSAHKYGNWDMAVENMVKFYLKMEKK